MEETKLYQGYCSHYTHLGLGVFLSPTFPERILVSGMVPGDEGVVDISYKRAGNYYGKIKKLSTLSPDRVDSGCKIHSACGGCLFQNVSYKRQLLFKKELVASQFSRLRTFHGMVEECVPSMPHDGARNKAQVPFGKDSKGRLVYGFYRPLSHDIVTFVDCPAVDRRIVPLLNIVKEAAVGNGIPPYEETSGHGELRHVAIRTSRHYGESMITVVTKHRDFVGSRSFFSSIVERLGKDDHLIHNVNPERTNVVLGKEEEVIAGTSRLRDRIGEAEFLISSKSFFQTNPYVTESLYAAIAERLSLNGSEVLLDAYGGIGTIGLYLSPRVKEVISVEWLKEATIDAKRNAELNGVGNFTAVNADVGECLSSLIQDGRKIDVVVLDPARKGCGEATMQRILTLAPKKIAYVSCSPFSLIDDLDAIIDHYSVMSVTPFDMFPHTPHVETLVILERK